MNVGDQLRRGNLQGQRDQINDRVGRSFNRFPHMTVSHHDFARQSGHHVPPAHPKFDRLAQRERRPDPQLDLFRVSFTNKEIKNLARVLNNIAIHLVAGQMTGFPRYHPA